MDATRSGEHSPGPALRSLDLFSGIGGITHALRGMAAPIAYCELDDNARAVLNGNMAAGRLPTAPICPDVRMLSAKWMREHAGVRRRGQRRSTPHVDLLAGGFPCVGFSMLGKQQGFDEAQSGLFSEVLRLVDELAPPLLFLENVPAILHLPGAMTRVAHELTHVRHYELHWCVVAAQDVGAPHLRRRWFCLAVQGGASTRSTLAARLRRLVEAATVAHTTFAWSPRSEPPRMLHRTSAVVRDSRTRHAMLGNAVVPDAVRRALLHLARAWLGGVRDAAAGAGGARKLGRSGSGVGHWLANAFGRGCALCRAHASETWPQCGRLTAGASRMALPAPNQTASPPAPPARLHLTFDPSVYKPQAPPPSATPDHTSPAITAPVQATAWATPRHGCTSASRRLSMRTVRDLPTQVRFEVDTPDALRGGVVNPEWVEWLMGFPQGWTHLGEVERETTA
jgi:hypothetical protein